MNYAILPEEDVKYLAQDILDDNGLLKPMPSAYYSTVPDAHLAMFGHMHGIYLFPTIELVDAVKQEIGNRKAIEIGSGTGCLGRALGIPMTDSHIQARSDIRELYDSIGQPPIKYPPDVLKMDAKEAIEHFKPECVVAAWVTQKWRKGDKDGFIYGVNEWDIINKVDKYILIGNFRVHKDKRIMRRGGMLIGLTVNKEMETPGIYSRSLHRELDAIWTWEKVKPGMDGEDK